MMNDLSHPPRSPPLATGQIARHGVPIRSNSPHPGGRHVNPQELPGASGQPRRLNRSPIPSLHGAKAGMSLTRGAVLLQHVGMASDERPVYVRLRDVIADAILEGRYRDGDPLPSVRALAAEHGANPLTVAKAYQTFQDDGLVVVRRGIGMFVADGASAKLRRQARQRFLQDEWPRVRAQIERLDLKLEELLDLA